MPRNKEVIMDDLTPEQIEEINRKKIAPAIAGRMRKREETAARLLVERGWLVVAPENVQAAHVPRRLVWSDDTDR